MKADGIADPDAADEQGRQPDQRKVEPDPIDQMLQPRRRRGKGADLPAGFGEGGARRRRPAVGIGIRRQPQPIMIGDEGSRPDQPGLAKGGGGYHHRRSKGEARVGGIGLALDGGAHLQNGTAHFEAVAEPEVEPVEDRCVDRRAEDPVHAAKRRGEVLRRLQHDLAVERIGGIDRPE